MTKTVKTLFTLSILLNILLLGIGAGFAIKEWREDPWWEQAKVELSPQSQDLLKKSFDKMHDDMAPLIAETREAREQLKNLMAQESFDSKKFDQITAHIRDVRQKMGDKMTATTKELVSNLSPDERKKMADRFVGIDWRHRKKAPWMCADKKSENSPPVSK
jgi:uncharacterized membrane protein